jgi:two-component system chemotaxis response regulator CheY
MFDPSTRVLVVDDMVTMRKLVIKTLHEIGFTDVSEAGDGIQGWTAIQEAYPPFGLVLSDWEMPHCTGIDLLRRVRHDSRFGKTPFVLLTAEASQDQIVAAAKAGVSQYVVKPFTAQTLREHLEHAWKKAGGK